MGKREASRASPQSSKRSRTTRADGRAQISSSSLRSKRPRTLDDAPPGLSACTNAAEILSSQPLKRPITTRAANQAKISSSSLLSKRPRSLLGCSYYDEIPSRLRKRKTLRGPCSAAHINFPSWGAKRARTARRPNRRDWANLGDGPAGLIAELVLANDVADYVRFRAVCRPWRRCSAHPRACGVLDRRFHPRGWITLREKHANPQIRRFLNVCTGRCIQVDLPELVDHRLLQSTSEGLLVLLCGATDVIQVDLDAGKTTRVNGLSGHAVFIGCGRTFSVPPQVFPNITADTVYPGFDMDERTGDEQIGACHIRDGSIEPSNCDWRSSLTHPLNAAEFLADCVRLV